MLGLEQVEAPDLSVCARRKTTDTEIYNIYYIKYKPSMSLFTLASYCMKLCRVES